jgi:hypothetical protein
MVLRGEGVVYTIPCQGRHEFVPQGVPLQRDGGRRVGFGHGEFAGRSFTRSQYEYGGTGHTLYLVACIVLQGDVWVFHQ